MNDEMTILFDSSAGITQLNELLDKVTEKRFSSPDVFVGTVRMALELHSIHLPPLQLDDENELVFQLLNTDEEHEGLYLYMVCDQDEDGACTAYAQIVNEAELEDLMDDDLLGAEAIDDSEEPEYILQNRHQGYDVD